MSDYQISQISPSDRRAARQLEALLKQEGIDRDRNLEYTVGMYDEDYRLIATGSCFQNTLRCLAVDRSHQGEGLLNQIVTHLMEYQCGRGRIQLYLYTKYDTAGFFSDLGFHEIARADGRVVFMENQKQGFSGYLKALREETPAATADWGLSLAKTGLPAAGISQPPAAAGSLHTAGAVVMNANPFTIGHLHLLERASSSCGLLHVFVVSEDVSCFPFEVRMHLVKEGSAHLNNLIYHQTGSYMISNATFPSYFLKDSDTVIRSHAGLDIEVFQKIAATLGITVRFVGEEPFSQVTSIYNQVMCEKLPQAGISCQIIPRLSNETGPVSASMIRKQIQEGRLEEAKALVPPSTYRYLLSEEAAPVLKAIRSAEDVVHY